MTEITGEEFVRLLIESSPEDSIDNYEITSRVEANLEKSYISRIISNCNFKDFVKIYASTGSKMVARSSLNFNNCTFDNLTINNVLLDYLSLGSVEIKGNFHTAECDINYFIVDNTNIINSKLEIRLCTFIYQFRLSQINNSKGEFSLRKNVFSNNEVNYTLHSTINNCRFNKLGATMNDFGFQLDFTNNTLANDTTDEKSQNYFAKSTFGKTNYSGTDFGKFMNFSECNFNGWINFYGIKNTKSSNLKFYTCNFYEKLSFYKCNLQSVNFYTCFFNQLVSFQEAILNTFKINVVLFEKRVLFDNLKLIDIKKCDRETLRTIKQELQKTDNKIDYNRFRAYELAAYYQELEWKKGFKDKAILWATKHVTGFDHSWQKALGFVLLAAFIFFSLFFVSENYGLPFAWSGIPKYITGYFRFLIVTDFYNPLNNGREYIANDGWNHIVSWFFFILGKIFIAFGIYEMIQAFRKFKA